MSSPFLVIALLERSIVFKKEDVTEALASLPDPANAKLVKTSDDGTNFQIRCGYQQFVVSVIPHPMPHGDFARSLASAGGKDLETVIAQHAAHLIVTCKNPGKGMSAAVMGAVSSHVIAAALGSLAKPLAAYWVSSERLVLWSEFTDYAASVLKAYDGGGDVSFPSLFWNSIQLTNEAGKIGGYTMGLQPFTGYDLRLTPVDWPLEKVAESIAGTLSYLFQAGPILEDGATVGVDDIEKFKLSKSPGFLQMTLEE